MTPEVRALVGSARRCIVPACSNEVVRVLVHRSGKSSAGLCAFHVRRAILYLAPEQVDRLVFPDLQGEGVKS